MAGEPRQGAGRLLAGEEEARRRIARELHDDHCQRLAALALELKAARQLAEAPFRRCCRTSPSASTASPRRPSPIPYATPAPGRPE